MCELAARAIAPTSRRTYSTAEKRYFSFCKQHQLQPLPATDIVLSYFAAHLSLTVQPSTVRVYMSAVRNLHVEEGLQYPTGSSTLLSRVLKGIERTPSSPRPRQPITTPVLRQLCERVRVNTRRPLHDRRMLCAAMAVAFHGFLRCGELVGLTPGDITVGTDSSSMTVHLKHSKTDTRGQGVDILIGRSTDATICPIRLYTQYQQIRLSAAGSKGSLFTYKSGTSLTKERLTEELRTLLALNGCTNYRHYASHSFRIGAATSAAVTGVPEWLIRRMGRWDSDAIYTYIRKDRESVLSVSAQLSSLQ